VLTYHDVFLQGPQDGRGCPTPTKLRFPVPSLATIPEGKTLNYEPSSAQKSGTKRAGKSCKASASHVSTRWRNLPDLLPEACRLQGGILKFLTQFRNALRTAVEKCSCCSQRVQAKVVYQYSKMVSP
jgi:hypothetical protein